MPGAVSENAIRIEGLKELQRAFRIYNIEMGKDFREAFLAAGDVAKQSAQVRAKDRLFRIRPPWSSMRIGFSGGIVWMAPVARGRRGRNLPGGSRRKSDLDFARRLRQEMDAAVDQNIGRIEQELDDALVDLGKAWARV